MALIIDINIESGNEFKFFFDEIDNMIACSDFQLLEPCFIDGLSQEMCSISANPAYLNSLPTTSQLKRLANSTPSVLDVELLHEKLDLLRRKARMSQQIIRLSRIEMALSLCQFLQKTPNYMKSSVSTID